VNVDVVVNIL